MANLKSRFLGSWIGDRLMREAEVVAATTIGAFVHVAVRSVAVPAAGDKLQVFFPDVGTRTYSPFACAKGRFELAVFLHDRGPSAAWARALAAGRQIRFVGPSASTPFDSIAGPVALFGDETSVGVARALHDVRRGDARVVLEVGTRAAVEPVIAQLGLTAELVERSTNGDHLATIARDLAAAGGTLVLTGNAKSIQDLRGRLKRLGSAQPQRVKSYWAEGKTGLD
jgi:NADPH-dependent ferric siderophore reductase